MVISGRNDVRRVRFNAPDGPGLELEVLSRDELGRRTGEALDKPLRTEFHRLMLVDAGHSWHEVDLIRHPLSPRTVLWVRPGQVQRFGPPVDSELVLFTPGVPAGSPSELAPLPVHHRGGLVWHLEDEAYRSIREIARQLRLEAAHPTTTSDWARRHLLSVLLLRISHTALARPVVGNAEGIAARFAAEVERDFARTHRVADYADRLGYTVRTLSRASTTASGHSAREVVEARITLEAKRLLAYTDLAAAVVGRRLGFSEPTNFGKFFLRRTGFTPGQFRRTLTR
jgi:AraC-like DNA-binding protein